MVQGQPSSFEVERFKARWVAQGYNMHKGIDYDNAYAFTLGTDSPRVLVAVAAFYGHEIYALDFKNFYLRGVLEGPPVYVEQPPLFKVKGKEDWACHYR